MTQANWIKRANETLPYTMNFMGNGEPGNGNELILLGDTIASVVSIVVTTTSPGSSPSDLILTGQQNTTTTVSVTISGGTYGPYNIQFTVLTAGGFITSEIAGMVINASPM